MPRYSGELVANRAYGPVTLYRDSFGVPAAFAATLEGAQFGFGFAQAEDHLPELLFLALQAGGRLAEAFGAPCLESDRWARTLGFARDADAGLAQIDPEVLRGVIAPFVAGINAYARRAGPSLPAWAHGSLPLTERDVLAIANLFGFALSLTSDAQGFGTRIALLPWGGRPGTSPSTASNAFALRGARTASGRPMLGANPHVHLSLPFLMYEARLKGGPLDIRGSTFFGLPSFIFGHTPSSAWGVTINYADTFDRYLLLGDGDGAGRYRYDEGWRALQVREERVRVLGGADEILRVEESVHGPVVERNPANGRAVALAWATRGDAGLIEQLHRMNLARDCAGFERALERRATPNYSFMLADAGDELLYAHVARVHERPRAPAIDGAPIGCGPLVVDWALNDAHAAAPCGASPGAGGIFWVGAVPGWTSATRWGELLPLAAFPLLRNPLRGWSQMANTPPWTATRPAPVPPCDVDALIAPCLPRYPYQQNLRGAQFTERLDGSAALTVEQAMGLLFDSRVPAAGYGLAASGEAACIDGEPPAVMRGAERCGALPALQAAWTRSADSLTRERRSRLAQGVALLDG
jgi:acyl-homoserine lactone acylase PvdQ